MSLLAQAAADLRAIHNDVDGGFALALTIRNPDGEEITVNGLQTDIGLTIDPETGVAVSGRRASVSISLADLIAASFDVPENVPDADLAPWLVTWTPPVGSAQTMKVIDSLPDKLGCVVLHLERYRDG